MLESEFISLIELYKYNGTAIFKVRIDSNRGTARVISYTGNQPDFEFSLGYIHTHDITDLMTKINDIFKDVKKDKDVGIDTLRLAHLLCI